MCGLVGVIARPQRISPAALDAACDSLSHRGPDARGVAFTTSGEWEISLGHRRLSIVDLSESGAQPMRVARRERDGIGVFNGEVYNFRALRALLSPSELRGTSDTEVLFTGLLERGPDFLRETNGPLAAFFFDRARRRVIVARDRLGKKPVYLYRGRDLFAVASELKAFAALGLPLTVSPEAESYVRWLGCVPGPLSIYRECAKLPAGTYLEIDLEAAELVKRGPTPFWDPFSVAGERYAGTFEDAVSDVTNLIDDATRLRIDSADVPVGVLLSSGIDSSLVAASAARAHPHLQAFIVRADAASLDESPVAERTARSLTLDPSVLALPRAAYDSQVDHIPWVYDEPLAALSQIPTMAISEHARRHVKVVLTGDGGDEAFIGYPWISQVSAIHRTAQVARRVAPLGRSLALALDSHVGAGALEGLTRALRRNPETLVEKRRTLRAALTDRRVDAAYEPFLAIRILEKLPPAARALLGDATLSDRARAWYPWYSWDALAERSLEEQLAGLELVTTMRDSILVKVDRGTMAHALEARSPLLDHRVVELGVRLPLEYKVRGREHKHVLREVCARRVGRSVASLPKRGFGIPPPPGLRRDLSVAAAWSETVLAEWHKRWPNRRGGGPGDVRPDHDTSADTSLA